MTNPAYIHRFSDRVDNYIKYRPGYPSEIIKLFALKMGYTPTSVIADVGSGTGILTHMFLKYGNPVYAVEPNTEMRQAAERLLAKFLNLYSINGTAENTGLPASCIDLITVGQAFHWFDAAKTKVEFSRILKPGGFVALIWNARELDATPFLRAYEDLLNRLGTDYERVQHRGLAEREFAAFFSPNHYQQAVFDNRQIFDFDGLKGRMLSSSYTPKPDSPNYQPLLQELREIFDRYQHNGYVEFLYKTKVYFGRLD